MNKWCVQYHCSVSENVNYYIIDYIVERHGNTEGRYEVDWHFSFRKNRATSGDSCKGFCLVAEHCQLKIFSKQNKTKNQVGTNIVHLGKAVLFISPRFPSGEQSLEGSGAAGSQGRSELSPSPLPDNSSSPLCLALHRPGAVSLSVRKGGQAAFDSLTGKTLRSHLEEDVGCLRQSPEHRKAMLPSKREKGSRAQLRSKTNRKTLRATFNKSYLDSFCSHRVEKENAV